ncbi:MAG: carbohydrate kinase [Muribaculaceae bacterium]|nr:carbohydrate kinase [Roseburia sp.]MCM1430673.1 carbohydrate kinase [Muribaculaceae bacterium]MCM1491940.1 carbohydrate kinase [Muribaculaceae bacterium]
MEKGFCDVVALGELLVDFTENGKSGQGNPLLEANPGGAPCNVLAMLQKLGCRTAFIGKVGKDSFGGMLRDAIQECGIDASGLLFDDEIPTTLAFVHTAEDGDRSFSFYRKPGADVMLREEEIPEELIASGRLFHFGTLSMTDGEVERATRRALAVAKENKLLVSFDPNLRLLLWRSPGDAREKMAYGMSQCDILKISDDEIYFFTGEEEIEAGIRQIRERFPVKLICATLGKNGSIAYYDDLRVGCEPFLQEKTIETTGAGDTFMGCILHGVLKNGIDGLCKEQLLEMLTVANAGASLITTRKGALKVMPEYEEICELRKQNGR